MGEKYLGEEFDIHGGGMDLMFPHHECEIAQNQALRGTSGVRYWVHNNMITIGGQKMGKSLGNFITLPELFAGTHPKLEAAYSPMTIRFFILQAHYRSTLDFSNEALSAAEKGLKRILAAYKDLVSLAKAKGVESTVKGTEGNPAPAMVYGELLDSVAPDAPKEGCSETVKAIFEGVYEALCDDINTPIALSHFFDAVKIINTAKEGKANLSKDDLQTLVDLFDNIVFGVFALKDETSSDGGAKEVISGLMDMVLEQRAEAKAAKDWAKSDAIRDHLKAIGITVKDTKNGPEWTME